LKMLAIFGCVNLIGRTTLVKGEPTRCATDQFLPCLTSLSICCCDNLRELFVLPPSVTHIHVSGCRNFEFIWGKGDIESENVHVEHHDTFTSSEHCNDLEYRSVPEQSSSAVNHPLPCLEMIHISFNDKMVELQNLPPSLTSLEFHSCPKLQSLSGQLHALKFLDIRCCNKLESLNCLGDLPSLERLCLVSCKRLASLACGPESYSSLSTIAIRYCPAMNMKPLYERLRPRLDILKERDLSHAHAKCPYGGTFPLLIPSFLFFFSLHTSIAYPYVAEYALKNFNHLPLCFIVNNTITRLSTEFPYVSTNTGAMVKCFLLLFSDA
jgi:hypothetical protein